MPAAPGLCRTALQAGAAPNLAAAGAALAAAFVRQGLAGSDTLVLARLMALLCSPLKHVQVRSHAPGCPGGRSLITTYVWLQS